MPSFPLRRIAIVTLGLQALALPAQAVPTASIHWGSCPSVHGGNRYDAASTGQTITVTATGLTGEVRGVSFRVGIWTGGSQVSDAWRYDPAGCQAGRLFLGQTANASCPSLRGANPYEFSRVDYYANPPGSYVGGREVIRYAVVFQPLATSPAITYTLGQLDLDHTNAILGGTMVPGSCTCLERPLCISLIGVLYQDGNGDEHPMAFGSEYISWNDPSNSLACPIGADLCHPECSWDRDTTCVASVPTPASLRSWGDVKATYR